MTKQAQAAASELIEVALFAGQSESVEVRAFGVLVMARVPGLLSGQTVPYQWTVEDIEYAAEQITEVCPS